MSEANIPLPAPPPPPLTTPPPPPNTVFRGPNGIRAGWRLLIFVAIAGAIFIALAVVAGVIIVARGGKPPSGGFALSSLTPLGLSALETANLLPAALAALIMTLIERRKWGQYGLPLRSALGKDFWIGTIVGFTAITGCLLGISLFHGFRITGMAIHGGTLLSATGAWSLTFLLVGLSEEFLFRGYVQYTLTTGMGFWPSAVLLSVLFGVAHAGNPGETKFGLVSVVLFGLLFCLFLLRRGNLWWAVGFHAGWDWGQTFFYGVPDSGLAPYHNLFNSAFHGPTWLTGGSVGPEASIFTPIVLGLVALLFATVYRKNLYQAP
ncbi:MAG TPA: CPBP family intramembrane glutamic endopeptidase [Candidatus Sulfotelmatobacter sp.]|nr:CPBP family intramembrane glutamic endopeptidase [Candidatus Sulfotelmatobacter sp.]